MSSLVHVCWFCKKVKKFSSFVETMPDLLMAIAEKKVDMTFITCPECYHMYSNRVRPPTEQGL